MPSTLSSDFYGTPVQADQASIPRKYIRTTDGSTSYWREEVAAALSGAQTTANQGAASSANPWFIQNDSSHAILLSSLSTIGAVLTTASITRIDPLTTASQIRIQPLSTDSTISALLSTASTVSVVGNTTVTPAAGTTWSVRPIATPNGEFTLETGTTVTSTFGMAISSNSGTTSLVTSGAGRVRVLSVFMQQQDASTVSQRVKFLTSNTTIAGAPEGFFSAREGAVLQAPSGAYLFQTSTGEALNINLSTNVLTHVFVTFLRTT